MKPSSGDATKQTGRRPFSRPPLIAVVLLLVLFGWAHGSAVADTNHCNGLTSSTFTQAFVRVDVATQPPPCQDDDFAVLGDSYALCINEDYDEPSAYHTFADADLGWELRDVAGHFPLPPNDLEVGVLLDVQGQRVSPALFVVDVSIYEGGWPPVSTTEVAVFRFSGDPNVFDGVEAMGVQDLVDLGLIASADVLAVASHTAEHDLDFEMDVDVTGLADEEIVIFGAAAGPIPPGPDVPATAPIAVIGLVLALCGIGSWAVWRGANS